MGGGQANKQQASAADAGATAAAEQAGRLSGVAQQQGLKLSDQSAGAGAGLQPQANEYGKERQQQYDTLWGNPSAPGGAGGLGSGALTPFLDTSKLNSATPTGPYALQLSNQNAQLATDTQNAIASARQSAANRGMGSSGVLSDAELKAQLAAAGTRGTNYSNALAGSHNEALQNFWNTVGASGTQQAAAQTGQENTQQLQKAYGDQAIGAAQTGTQQAIGANQGAGQTYGQLYGTAGQYHASPVAGIVQSAIGAGGAIGGAAANPAGKAASKAAAAGNSFV